MTDELLRRVERLERTNRVLIGLLGLVALGAIVGFQATPEVLKVKRLEIVDSRGVPMVTLDTGRKDEGGQIVLRDNLGERRGWWTTSPEGSSLALSHAATGDEKSATAGLSASPTSAEMNLIGPDGALLSTSVRRNQPRIDLWNAKGEVLFGAPFNKAP